MVLREPSGLAPAIDLEMLVEPEMGEDALRRRFQLGGGHGQPDAGGVQVGQQRSDPVEQGVHRPAPGAVLGAEGRDRRVGVLAEFQRAKRVVHRRPDDLGGQVALGYRGTDMAERVQEAGDDPFGGVGEGAVEIEDHQLRGAARRRCCAGVRMRIGPGRHRVSHDPIVSDLAAV